MITATETPTSDTAAGMGDDSAIAPTALAGEPIDENQATPQVKKKSEPKIDLDSQPSGGYISRDQGSGASLEITPRDPITINLKSLLEAGAHFGHQTSRWNPEMAPFIYGSRNGIHIIDLPKSIQAWNAARKVIVNIASEGGSILFVGTKKQAQQPVMEEALRCGAFFVTRRWLGGMLTNFQTIRKSIQRMKQLSSILGRDGKPESEEAANYTKKERLMMSRELDKLDFSLGGIQDMYAPPKLMFVVDIKREDIAIKEAHRLNIPVVALVDTNCSPSKVDHPIPSNDDGTRAVRIFAAAVADAVTEGREMFKKRGGSFEAVKEAEEKRIREEEASMKGDRDKDKRRPKGDSRRHQRGQQASEQESAPDKDKADASKKDAKAAEAPASPAEAKPAEAEAKAEATPSEEGTPASE